MNKVVLLVVYVLGCSLQPSIEFTMKPFLRLSLGGTHSQVSICRVDPPSRNVSVSRLVGYGSGGCVSGSVWCAWMCTMDINCVSFNYRGDGEMCEMYYIYSDINTCYDSVPQCLYYYQVKWRSNK